MRRPGPGAGGCAHFSEHHPQSRGGGQLPAALLPSTAPGAGRVRSGGAGPQGAISGSAGELPLPPDIRC
jgi:hypothetical protein